MLNSDIAEQEAALRSPGNPCSPRDVNSLLRDLVVYVAGTGGPGCMSLEVSTCTFVSLFDYSCYIIVSDLIPGCLCQTTHVCLVTEG